MRSAATLSRIERRQLGKALKNVRVLLRLNGSLDRSRKTSTKAGLEFLL